MLSFDIHFAIRPLGALSGYVVPGRGDRGVVTNLSL